MEDSALRELATRSAAGDMDAVEALIQGFHSRLFSTLHLLNVPRSDVEEAAQEVVIHMYRGLRRYRPDQPFLPWLRSIARHVVFNYWRGRRRDGRRLEIFASYVESAVEANDECASDVSSSRLQGCIDRLQDKHRAMVKLRYFQGLDSTKIAEQMRLSAAAVRQSLARIREILRACVKSPLGMKTS